MKITMKKSELEQITGVVKTIFEKAIVDLEWTTLDVTSFDAMLNVFETQETIDTETAIISVTADEITVEVKEEFINEYMVLLAGVSNDVLDFVGNHKPLVKVALKSIIDYFKQDVKITVMFHLLPVMNPGKKLWEQIQTKIQEFATKF